MVIVYLCKCGTQRVVDVCSTLYNQIRTQCEKTNWKFDIMWVVLLEVKVYVLVNSESIIMKEIDILISVMFITQVKWTCINCPWMGQG